MSRYEYPATRFGAETVALGWDRPLATFFVTVFGSPGAHGDDTIIEWRGTARREITSGVEAVTIARRYADIPDDVVGNLEIDRLKTLGTSDGPAQRQTPRF